MVLTRVIRIVTRYAAERGQRLLVRGVVPYMERMCTVRQSILAQVDAHVVMLQERSTKYTFSRAQVTRRDFEECDKGDVDLAGVSDSELDR